MATTVSVLTEMKDALNPPRIPPNAQITPFGSTSFLVSYLLRRTVAIHEKFLIILDILLAAIPE